MILALALIMLGATNAMGQKIYQAELDKSMFKAWDGWGAGANEVAEPEEVEGNAISCEYTTYTQVGAGKVVFGHDYVYYLWYADLTGTKTMTINATAGMQFRILMNRPAPEEGGDSHGGKTTEINVTVAENGQAVVDLSSYEYVHLNAIKTGWGSPAGTITSIMLEGTVKPVTGYLDLISNGDAEGDDLSSFPLALHANEGDDGKAAFFPEVVEGEGVDGSKAFKIVSDNDAPQTWTTQQFIKFDEPLREGDKWRLSMDIRAARPQQITSSAQGAPRSWHGGFVDGFDVTTNWQTYTFSGTVSSGQAGSEGFGSIALDLNTDQTSSNTFWFDNIVFQKDLGGSNPMSEVTAQYGSDAICIYLADKTNMKALVKAAGGETLIYDNSCATVTWNGKTCNLISVEGRPDGNLYVFLLDMDGEGGDSFEAEDAVVTVSFVNPADAAYHLQFTAGKWDGEAVPDFTGMACEFNYSLGEGEIFSYLWGSPKIDSAAPEIGSFNLPADTKEFVVNFNQKVDVTTVVAKLGKENLKVSAESNLEKTVTLTRTANTELSGTTILTISAAVGEKGMELDVPLTIRYSFGPVVSEGDDPKVIYQSDFAAQENPGAGWKVNADGGGLQDANTGAGCRLLHSQGAFVDDLLYLAQRSSPNNGVALYGIVDEYKLALEGGKTYHLTFGACRHDRTDVALEAQVLPEAAVSTEDGSLLDEGAIIVKDRKEITPEKSSKEAIRFDLTVPVQEDGNYVLRFVPSKSNGAYQGYEDAICFGDVKVEYIPDVMGLVETKNLTAALDRAKESRNNNSDDRFNGPAFTALEAAIASYDGKVETMTAPSAFAKAIDELDAAVKAMGDHRRLCDDYDKLPDQLFSVYDSKKDTKFNSTELFAQVKATVQKYCTVENETIVDDNGQEVQREALVGFLILKDDAELTAAISELNTIVGLGNNFFTEGVSNDGDAGIKVLVDRLRMGAETLKALGVDANDPLILAVNESMTDDEDLAKSIQNRVKLELFNQLKNADNTVFAPVVDETTEEVTYPTVDMTIFTKNPNMYAIQPKAGFSTENVPGWSVIRGNPGFWGSGGPAWGNTRNIDGLPEDIALTTYHSEARFQQSVTNLPAGIYTVSLIGTDWGNMKTDEGTGPDALGFVYAKLSDTPVVEEGAEEDRELNFAATKTIEYAGQYQMNKPHNLENLVITDGKLTFGVHYGNDSQYFFGNAKLFMTGAATGFDYAKAYEEVLTGIDVTVAKPAQVRHIELFDLNGRHISSARKGIAIVKKHMSDGTIKTEKVVVK